MKLNFRPQLASLDDRFLPSGTSIQPPPDQPPAVTPPPPPGGDLLAGLTDEQVAAVAEWYIQQLDGTATPPPSYLPPLGLPTPQDLVRMELMRLRDQIDALKAAIASNKAELAKLDKAIDEQEARVRDLSTRRKEAEEQAEQARLNGNFMLASYYEGMAANCTQLLQVEGPKLLKLQIERGKLADKIAEQERQLNDLNRRVVALAFSTLPPK